MDLFIAEILPLEILHHIMFTGRDFPFFNFLDLLTYLRIKISRSFFQQDGLLVAVIEPTSVKVLMLLKSCCV